MIVTRLPSGIEQWIAQRTGPSRSKGFHVSVVILAMLKEIAPRKYAGYGEGKSDREPIYELGYVWEDLLGTILTERVMLESGEYLLSEQTEIQLDGIYGTPDRIVLGTDGAPILEETKLTWKWYVEDLESPKFLYWLLQVKTYCAMIGATRARIRALFINELHAGSFVVPGCWELTYEPHELTEWWQSVVRFAAAHPELEAAA